jgi:hypothetical protein
MIDRLHQSFRGNTHLKGMLYLNQELIFKSYEAMKGFYCLMKNTP